MSLQIKLSDYYIAYFDILGYRGLFSGNEGQNCEIIENIITAFNKISNSINQNNSSSILQAVDLKIEKRMFSDNIVFCLSVENGASEVFRIMAFLNQICDFQKGLCLEHKIFIRGAIVKDKAYLSEHTIQGPGIIKAASMEEKDAVYPRILLDASIENAINSNCANDGISQIVGSWLKKIIQVFPDDKLFLNYLYNQKSLFDVLPELQDEKIQTSLLNQLKEISISDFTNVTVSLKNSSSTKSILEKHKNVLIEKIKQYSNYDDVKNQKEADLKERIIKKYHWVLSYHNLMCKLNDEMEFEIKYADIIDYRYGTFLIMLVDNNTGNERSDKTIEK